MHSFLWLHGGSIKGWFGLQQCKSGIEADLSSCPRRGGLVLHGWSMLMGSKGHVMWFVKAQTWQRGGVWGLSGIRLGLGPVCFVAQLVEGLGWEQSQHAWGLALGQAQGS